MEELPEGKRRARELNARLKLLARESPEAGSVAQGLLRLDAILGMARLYGGRHRHTKAAADEALPPIQDLIEQHGVLELETSLEGLLWRGHNVHPEGEEGQGFGKMLHREGIRSISFESALRRDGLIELFEVLRVNLSLPQHEEETMELLLWQAQIDGFGFQTFSALTEAEVLSGQFRDGVNAVQGDDALAVLLDTRSRQDERLARAKALTKLVTEESLHQAVDESGLQEMSGGDEARDPLADAEWAATFSGDDPEDAKAIEILRREIEGERPSDVLARLCLVLFEAAEADRPELQSRVAIDRAWKTLEAMYAGHDPVGLTKLLKEGRRFVRHPRLKNRPGAVAAVRFIRKALEPMRVANLLSKVDPADDPEAAAAVKRLVSFLPDDALRAMLEWCMQEKQGGEDARIADLVKEVARAAGDRIGSWLENADRLPGEQVVPIVTAMRALGGGRGIDRRVALFKHPSPLVKEAAVSWCEDELQPDELRPLLDMMLDHDGNVRRAATTTLQSHTDPAALAWFMRAIESPRFARLDERSRLEVFRTLGAIVGPRAIEPMSKRLDSRDRQEIREAAHALAMISSPAARDILEKGAGAILARQKKQACEEALRRTGR